MANGKTLSMASDTVLLADGLVSIAREAARYLAPRIAADGKVEANGRGIVLANDRMKVHILHDGVPVEYTFTFGIQRAAVTDDEKVLVSGKAEAQTASKAKREADEQAKRDREIARAVELTQNATFGTLRSFEQVARGMAIFSNVTSTPASGK